MDPGRKCSVLTQVLGEVSVRMLVVVASRGVSGGRMVMAHVHPGGLRDVPGVRMRRWVRERLVQVDRNHPGDRNRAVLTQMLGEVSVRMLVVVASRGVSGGRMVMAHVHPGGLRDVPGVRMLVFWIRLSYTLSSTLRPVRDRGEVMSREHDVHPEGPMDMPVARMLVAQQGVPGPDSFQKGRIVMAHVSPGGLMELVLGFPDHCPVGMSDN